MGSLSKLKSVLVTDSHAQLLQRPCSATYGHEQWRRRLPSSSGDALPEGQTVCSVRIVPSAPGRRCPPTYCQELVSLSHSGFIYFSARAHPFAGTERSMLAFFSLQPSYTLIPAPTCNHGNPPPTR